MSAKPVRHPHVADWKYQRAMEEMREHHRTRLATFLDFGPAKPPPPMSEYERARLAALAKEMVGKGYTVIYGGRAVDFPRVEPPAPTEQEIAEHEAWEEQVEREDEAWATEMTHRARAYLALADTEPLGEVAALHSPQGSTLSVGCAGCMAEQACEDYQHPWPCTTARLVAKHAGIDLPEDWRWHRVRAALGAE